MSNNFMKELQKITESFKGPRTDVIEFQKKFDKIKKIDKALNKLKLIINNFNTYFEKLVCYNREINEVLFLIYDDEYLYKDMAFNLEKLHTNNIMLFQKHIINLIELNKKTVSWENNFSNIPPFVKEKEQTKKVNDHYEKKIHKLFKEKSERIKKLTFDENSNFAKKLNRNEEKYLKAKQAYLNKAALCYDTMEMQLNKRFDFLNPVISDLITIETKVFESLYKNYKNFYDAQNLCKNKVLIILKKVVENEYNNHLFNYENIIQKPDQIASKRRNKSLFASRSNLTKISDCNISFYNNVERISNKLLPVFESRDYLTNPFFSNNFSLEYDKNLNYDIKK